MNAFIIDDRISALSALRALLATYCTEVNIAGTATSYADAVEQLGQVSREIDIIFCDIDLGGPTGFDVLDRLQSYGGSVVFVSAHQEFALKAFQYEAVDYLTKPVSPQELIKAVERAKKWQKANGGTPSVPKINAVQSISVYLNGRWLIIPTEQIVYIKSHQNYSHIYVQDQAKPHISSYGLRYFEEKLQGCTSFIRVQKSYIINQQYLTSVSKQDSSLELAGGIHVPVGGGIYRDVLTKLLGK